jgi:hypothetical protein
MNRALAADVPQTGFHFDDKTHHYFYDGKPMTGCTTILSVLAKPALVPWAARMAVEHVRQSVDWNEPTLTTVQLDTLLDEARSAHAKKRDTAADAGTDLHALVEEYVAKCIENNGGLPIPMEGKTLAGGIDPFIEWATKENIRFIATEQRLYSKELWVAGTVDLIFEKDGKRYVGDIKTYKKIWDRVPLIQCAGYALMWQEMNEAHNGGSHMTARVIDGYCVICLPKERAFNEVDDVLWSHDTEGDRVAFESCVRLYRYLNQK